MPWFYTRPILISLSSIFKISPTTTAYSETITTATSPPKDPVSSSSQVFSNFLHFRSVPKPVQATASPANSNLCRKCRANKGDNPALERKLWKSNLLCPAVLCSLGQELDGGWRTNKLTKRCQETQQIVIQSAVGKHVEIPWITLPKYKHPIHFQILKSWNILRHNSFVHNF